MLTGLAGMDSPSTIQRIAADSAAAWRLAVLYVGIESGLLPFLVSSGRPFIPQELGQKLDLDTELTAAWCRAAIECEIVTAGPLGTIRAHPSISDLPLDEPGALDVAQTVARIAEDVLPLPGLLRTRGRLPPERHGAEWLETRATRRLWLARAAARAAANGGVAATVASADGLSGHSDLAWLRRELPAAEWRPLAGARESGGVDLLVLPATLHEVSASLQGARLAQLRAALRPGGTIFVLEILDDPFLALSLCACGRAPLPPSRVRLLLERAGFADVCDVASPAPGCFGIAARLPCA
jgi:hypothetical protein